VKTFDVEVHREGNYWVAEVLGVRGGATETRRLANLDAEVTDLLSGLLDLDPDQIRLRRHLHLTPGAMKMLEAYAEARIELEEARQRYDRVQRDAVHELRAADLSLRDSAELLGVSFQRVQQLVSA
jgi:DNA-directed RNA polymerase specialized sigma24 family protein